MGKIFFILIVMASFLNAEWWTLEEKSPMNPSIYVVSPDKTTSLTLYASTEKVKENELQKQFIQIITSLQSRWLTNITEDSIIKTLKFIDNNHVLIVHSSMTSTVSTILDLDTNKQKLLGDGNARYITSGKNKGYFLLSSSKGYIPKEGPFWVNKVVDKDGDLIEFLSYPDNGLPCVQVKNLLDMNEKYPKLKQKLTDCIFVER